MPCEVDTDPSSRIEESVEFMGREVNQVDIASKAPGYGLHVDWSAHSMSVEKFFNKNLTPSHLRPYGSPIFLLVIAGNVQGIRYALTRCEASIWDHDPYGLGLLYVRVCVSHEGLN